MTKDERLKLVAAFAAVYLVWGSTYLAIRYAIDTIPPFLMGGCRFVVAGLVMLGWARLRGAAWPNTREWQTAGITGSLLLIGGNGAVVWAEQRVPSSLAALMVAIVPLSTALLDWIRPNGRRPTLGTLTGLATGFAGVAILVNPGASDAARVDGWGALALFGATLSWGAGSIYSRSAKGADSPLMAAGANMLLGGIGLSLLGALAGEFSRIQPAAISLRSALAVLYLIVFGSLIGFTAYTWLLRNTSTVKATTYAYVNPVVAIILGWALADEPMTARIVLAATVIIIGVIMITTLPYARAWLLARRDGSSA